MHGTLACYYTRKFCIIELEKEQYLQGSSRERKSYLYPRRFVEENAWYIGMLLYKEADYRRKKNSICKEAVAKGNPIIPGRWVVAEENAWYIGMLLYKEADYRRKKNSICKEAVAKDNPIIPGSWVVVEENAWYIGMLYTGKLIIEGIEKE
jgi:hypothetical protein